MKKISLVIIFFLVAGFSFCDEIEKGTFENLLNVFYSRYKFCTIEITFSAERFSDMDSNKIRYYLITADMGFETYKQMFQISKKNLHIYINFEDETVGSYHYTEQNRTEFFRNFNKALQFFEKI
jgi:hypothetical protein